MALYNLLILFLLPSGFCCSLLVAALVFRKRKRAATTCLVLAVLSLLAFGNRWFVDVLARSLEWKHLPAYPLPKAEAIVCLGGGNLPLEAPRQTVEVGEAGDRMTYAAHLYREGKAPLIVCTGGVVPGTAADHPGSADIAAMLRMIGVPAGAIIEQSKSRNTYEDATCSYPILKERKVKRVLLVTSAAHMPRSLAVFRKQCPDLEVIPAPTDFTVTKGSKAPFWEVLRGCVPTGHELGRSDAILHEYIGILYYKLRGWI